MSDIKKQKSPIEKSFDSLLNSATGDLQKTVNEKVKQVISAKKAYDASVYELNEAVEEMELTKKELADIFKGIK